MQGRSGVEADEKRTRLFFLKFHPYLAVDGHTISKNDCYLDHYGSEEMTQAAHKFRKREIAKMRALFKALITPRTGPGRKTGRL